jgi:hypothetical protein
VLGYHPAKPRLYQAFMDTVGISNLRTLQLLNTKYVMTDGYYPPDAAGVKLRHDGPVKIYEIEGALPRAFVVHRVLPVRDESMGLAVLRAGGLEPREEALWAKPGPLPELAPPSARDSVRTLKYDFNESAYSVATAAPGLLVTVEQWDPDWHATVDGKPAVLERVNYLMRGVLLGPGVHDVRFHYVPRALEAGVRISTGSLIVTLLLAAAGVARRRRARSEAPPPTAGDRAARGARP